MNKSDYPSRQRKDPVTGQFLKDPTLTPAIKYIEKSIYDKEFSRKFKQQKSIAAKKWRINNLERAKKTGRVKHLRAKYGMTIENYNYLFSKQNNSCAICKVSSPETRFHVDHDHDTGLIRGILCQRCNTGLGYYENFKTVFKLYLETGDKYVF